MLRHDISDEQLDMLGSGKRDGLAEAVWCAAGGAASLSPTTVANLIEYTKDRASLGSLQLAETIIFFVMFALFLGLLIVLLARGKHSDDLVARIRAQSLGLPEPSLKRSKWTRVWEIIREREQVRPTPPRDGDKAPA